MRLGRKGHQNTSNQPAANESTVETEQPELAAVGS